ncbi:MAG TPA: hypothetical protein VMC85_04295 [Desulfomonilaceae bacterium]|nr:hypothetical protein [Desulfomonilaceae bacterium]
MSLNERQEITSLRSQSHSYAVKDDLTSVFNVSMDIDSKYHA